MAWVWIGITDLLIIAGGWSIIWLDQEETIEWGQPAIVAGLVVSLVGVLTFFMTLHRATENSMRNAITAAFVAAYLPLLGFIVFGPDIGGSSGGSPQADDLLKAFSAMVTVIVGFYFAAAAAQVINERIQMRRENVAAGIPGPPPTKEI